VRGVLARRALPEGEGVDEDDVRGADDGVAGAVGELVPRVGRADLDGFGQLALDCRDLVLELLAGEVAAVQRLGADGDGVDLGSPVLGGGGNGVEVVVERFLDIGPENLLLAIAVTCEQSMFSLPDAQHDLEALLLGSRENGLGHVAVGSRVSAHQLGGGRRGNGIEIGFIVGLCLARAIRVLRSEREAHHARRGHDSGRRDECDGGETHLRRYMRGCIE
jgi:hypothetical protein